MLLIKYLLKMILRKIETLKDKQSQISVEENFLNLKFFSKIISKIEHFVFGTLLGLVRDGNLIENDDDIDFYVNIKERKINPNIKE